MQKYFAHADSVKVDSKEFDFYVELYLATQVDARIAELENALQALCDEQNGPPLERRKDQWQRAFDQARALLTPVS